MANKQIASVGYQIPGKSNFELGFSSKKSLLDSDIILFSPTIPYYDLSDTGSFQGKTCYSEHGSFQLKEDLKHWETELSNALKSGKTVVFLLDTKRDFYVHSGRREFSGTGRNRQITNLVDLANNYQLLPTNIGRVTSAQGQKVIFTGLPTLQNINTEFKEHFEFRAYLEEMPDCDVAFTAKDKSKILGAQLKVSSGSLILLPYIEYDEESFTEYKKNKEGEEEERWNQKGETFGSKLIQCLLDLDKSIRGELIKTPLPEWAKEQTFVINGESKLQAEITANISKIQEIEEQNKELDNQYQSLISTKDLLFEKGTPLENSVIDALEALGFKAENYDDGELELDQVISSPEGKRCIGECEGKDKKAVNVTKMRQLVDSLNADLYKSADRDERALGILFGNPQRLDAPDKRKQTFTDKCKKTAEREGIVLVLTKDLFSVVRYIKANKDTDYQLECRKAIYQSAGKVVTFPKIPSKKAKKVK